MKHNFLFVAVLFSTIFTVNAVAQTAGYVLYGNGPAGYTDLTGQVSVTALGTAAFESGVFTGAGLPGRICESSNYLQLSFAAAQTMNLTDKFALHVVLQKDGEAADKVQVSFCKNGWNAARISWEIENASIAAGDASDIVLKYGDCRGEETDNWNSYNASTFIGEVEYPAAEIMRICAANGEKFAINAIYLEASYSGTTAISSVSTDIKATKTLRDGQLFILRGNTLYDLNGNQVQ